MQRFLRTYGGMVPEGEPPSEELIGVFENFESPETMFAWLSERWTTGSFDKIQQKTIIVSKLKKDPNKPKWCNAYMHFTIDNRATFKESNPDKTNTEITKELARVWREMNEDQRAPYQKASDTQKADYEKAMKSYNPPQSSTADSKKTSKKKRSEDEPKKGLNAYMHFTIVNREVVKGKHPHWSNTDITKELGRMWREDFTDEDKKPYQKTASEDKQRYELEMKSYKPNQTNPSTEKTPPKKSPKKAAKKATEKTQLEKAYDVFVEVESDAAAEEREDEGETPFTVSEMDTHLAHIWESLSQEDRLAYLEE